MSHSRFWGSTAIFVIEDDAQAGPDHVDAHRTAGLVISPYVRRHSVDHTLYTTASFIRTMELALGLPPMTQYDAGATPLFHSFTDTAVPRALHGHSAAHRSRRHQPEEGRGRARSRWAWTFPATTAATPTC